MAKQPHTPVLMKEFLDFFADMKLKVFFDGTLGAGGHAEAILDAHPEIQVFIGCDRDENAIDLAKERLKRFKSKVKLVHGNFSDLDECLKELKIKEVDGFFLTWGCRLCN